MFLLQLATVYFIRRYVNLEIVYLMKVGMTFFRYKEIGISYKYD